MQKAAVLVSLATVVPVWLYKEVETCTISLVATFITVTEDMNTNCSCFVSLLLILCRNTVPRPEMREIK